MKKVLVLTVVGVMGAVVAAYSLEAKLPGQWWRKPDVAAKLKLDDEQVRALDQAAFDSRTKAIEIKARLKKKRNEIEYLLRQDPIDKKTVIRASEEMAEAGTEILANRIDGRLAARETLSGLQREKVEEMAQPRRRRDDKRGRGKRHRGRRSKAGGIFGKAATGEWWENPGVAAEVGLTQEQRGELRDSSYKLGQVRIGLEADKEIKELALRSAMDDPDVERKTIDGIIGEIGEIEKDLARNRAESMIAEREILTVEQVDKLEAVRIEEAKDRREFIRERALKRAGGERRAPERRRRPGYEGAGYGRTGGGRERSPDDAR